MHWKRCKLIVMVRGGGDVHYVSVGVVHSRVRMRIMWHI